MSDSHLSPGWYHAEGDPAGTHRYWDGEIWQGQPVPVNIPDPPSSYPAPGASYPGASYPEQSQATAALVFAILGLVLCGILAPFGWIYANRELQGIAAGRRDPAKKGMTDIARVLSIVGTVLLVLGLLAIVFFFAVLVLSAGGSVVVGTVVG